MASNKKERPPSFVTPIGIIKWAHVHKPKPPFKGEESKGSHYEVDIAFSISDPAWKKWASEMKAKIDALPVQIDRETDLPMPHKQPIKFEFDGDKKTGNFTVKFKSNERFRPSVVDGQKNLIPENVIIGNGSLGRVSYTEAAYDRLGGGIALYLNGVQVTKLEQYVPAARDHFPNDLPAQKAGPGLDESDTLPF